MNLAKFRSLPGTLLSRTALYVALISLSGLQVSCGGGGGTTGGGSGPPPVTYSATSGVAQKGPLLKGATVTAQELNAGLSPTGKQYSYQTTSDLGTFSPTSTFTSQYIGLNATGYYFDEVQNAVSNGPVTLNGYSDLTIDSVLNVNLLTTLAYQRISHLVTSSNMAFAAARTQAENEVLTALNIPTRNSYGSFGSLDISGGTDGDHILAAISSIFVYGNSAGPLSSLIANFQSDIGTNGAITNAATRSTLVAAAKALNPAAIAANLTQKYASVGVTISATNISDWIDQDGDGVVGKFKFQVPDASPSSVFTFPSFVVSQVAGATVSVTAGQLSVNGTPASGPVSIQAGDVITLSPGVGAFPNGVLTAYLSAGSIRVARVSFVSGLVSIAVTPSSPSIADGLTQQFTATGTFSDASTADLTTSAAWTSGTPTIATVNATSGLATSVAVGSTIITAKSGSVSGSSALIVTPAVVESISISPNPAFTGIGLSRQLTATGTYSDGTTANVTTTAIWTSGTQSVATVGPTTGLTTGVSLGTSTISATIGSVTATASLSVVANMWSPTGSLTNAREEHTATLLPNGKVLVAGGTEGGPSITASAELYDPAAGTWSPTGSLTNARADHTATLLPNGKVLVAGGNMPIVGGGTAITGSAELYDPAAGTWSLTGSLTTARSGHTATLLANGKILVSGGHASGAGGATASAELYDPVAGTWSPTGDLSSPRYDRPATLLPNGKVLVAGGYGPGGDTATAELYDPVAGTWSSTGNLATARWFHTATLLPNGMVLVAGGFTLPNAPLASAELYDPVAGTWSSTGSMSARSYFTATLLTNGTVLAAGGITIGTGTGAPTASADLYDPAAGTWSSTGSLSTPRYLQTATLLPNGVVLVVGGHLYTSPFATITSSAELYW
jgi:hypothetical protein